MLGIGHLPTGEIYVAAECSRLIARGMDADARADRHEAWRLSRELAGVTRLAQEIPEQVTR